MFFPKHNNLSLFSEALNTPLSHFQHKCFCSQNKHLAASPTVDIEERCFLLSTGSGVLGILLVVPFLFFFALTYQRVGVGVAAALAWPQPCRRAAPRSIGRYCCETRGQRQWWGGGWPLASFCHLFCGGYQLWICDCGIDRGDNPPPPLLSTVGWSVVPKRLSHGLLPDYSPLLPSLCHPSSREWLFLWKCHGCFCVTLRRGGQFY